MSSLGEEGSALCEHRIVGVERILLFVLSLALQVGRWSYDRVWCLCRSVEEKFERRCVARERVAASKQAIS